MLRCLVRLSCWAFVVLGIVFVSYQLDAVKAQEDLNLTSSNITSEDALESFSNETEAPTEPPIMDCELFHYDCYGCLNNPNPPNKEGTCYWCPTDGLCFNEPEFNNSATISSAGPEPKLQALYPNRKHRCLAPVDFTTTNCTAAGNFFADPLYSAQRWIFEQIRIVPVWERGYFGTGVNVRINDDPLESSHPEFVGRIDVENSCPNSTEVGFPHGMAVASILGASANNDNCGVGIAPNVTLSICKRSNNVEDLDFMEYNIESIDISQNSWAYEGCGGLAYIAYGKVDDKKNNRNLQTPEEECPFKYKPNPTYPSPCEVCNFTYTRDTSLLGEECIDKIVRHCGFFPREERNICLEFLDVILYDANEKNSVNLGVGSPYCYFGGMLPKSSIDLLTRGVTEGRNGKGIIYVFSAGNEYATGDDTNFQQWGANTRFTIPVAGLDKAGNVSSYSTPGASIFVAAPGGDQHEAVTNMVAATVGGQCQDAGQGTSYAAPVVSGVIALMLEANPELTWRDVQLIIAITSQKVPGTPVGKNGAGLFHSYRYGFGIINAEFAVNLSENWVNIGPEISMIREGKGSEPILDSRRNTTSLSLVFNSGATEFVTESVYLYIRLNHSSRGHLRISLFSPSGMQSLMSPGERPEAGGEWMKFTSVRYWGEDPNGKWTINITDTTPGPVRDCIDYDDYQFSFTETVDFGCSDYPYLGKFCRNNSFNPFGPAVQLCEANITGSEIACETLERFLTEKSNNRTALEACCLCGGGYNHTNDAYPETIVEWKIQVYGHEKSTQEGFFSGIGNGVELGKWGGRGIVFEGDRLENSIPSREQMEALVGVPQAFGGLRRKGL